MKNKLPFISLGCFLWSITAPFSLYAADTAPAKATAPAQETLWKLTFKDLAPGQGLAEVAYTPPCAGPQKVVADGDNTLVGAKAVGALTSTPLLFTKKTATNYTPSFTLSANAPNTTGTITISMDLVFDTITVGQVAGETLMAINLFQDPNLLNSFSLIVVCADSQNLILSGTMMSKGETPAKFKLGEVAHLKAVLNLDQHTFQLFLNDTPASLVEHDDAKFSCFQGLTVRDGTALGGNKGATFTAGIANLVVTHG